MGKSVGTGKVETTPGMFMHNMRLYPNLRAYEPQHDNTNKVTVHPAKTQISLGIRAV